jgi:hypothetical protein
VIRIKDNTGEVVQGAFRTDSGAIAMHDPVGYSKYLKEKERAMEVTRLNKRVNDLESMVQRLVSIMEDKNDSTTNPSCSH